MRTHLQHFTGSASSVKELATLDAQGGQVALVIFQMCFITIDTIWHQECCLTLHFAKLILTGAFQFLECSISLNPVKVVPGGYTRSEVVEIDFSSTFSASRSPAWCAINLLSPKSTNLWWFLPKTQRFCTAHQVRSCSAGHWHKPALTQVPELIWVYPQVRETDMWPSVLSEILGLWPGGCREEWKTVTLDLHWVIWD